jgi:hypothetical protein
MRAAKVIQQFSLIAARAPSITAGWRRQLQLSSRDSRTGIKKLPGLRVR